MFRDQRAIRSITEEPVSDELVHLDRRDPRALANGDKETLAKALKSGKVSFSKQE